MDPDSLSYLFEMKLKRVLHPNVFLYQIPFSDYNTWTVYNYLLYSYTMNSGSVNEGERLGSGNCGSQWNENR